MSRTACLLTLAAATAVAGAWSPAPLRAGDQPARPFRGTAVGMVTGVVPPNELVIEYTGTATHLGRFTPRSTCS